MTEPETGSIELLAVPPGSLPPFPAPPPARPPAPELQPLSSQAGTALVHAGVSFQAATDLGWAWHHLVAAAMGWTIVDRLGTGRIDPKLLVLFGDSWDALEVAAMSLGFGETVSALDLCADAVLLAYGEQPQPKGRLYDLGQLRKRRPGLAAGPPSLLTWVDQLLAHPDLAGLQECRDHVTHRTPRRHISVKLNKRGLPSGRALTEITTLHGKDGARWQGSIADLVPRAVRFGEQQLEALCRAILTPGEPR